MDQVTAPQPTPQDLTAALEVAGDGFELDELLADHTYAIAQALAAARADGFALGIERAAAFVAQRYTHHLPPYQHVSRSLPPEIRALRMEEK